MQKWQITAPYSYWSNIIYHLKLQAVIFNVNYLEEQRDIRVVTTPSAVENPDGG